MRIETTDIIRTIVSNLVFTFEGTDITTNPDGTFTILSCNTYHLQPGFYITIDGVEYLIRAVDHNISITIEGPSEPTVLEFTTYPIFFFHGTVTQQNLEFSKMEANQKTPMVYLIEGFDEVYYNRDQIKDRDSNVRLFFMTQANFKDWLTTDHYEQAVKPMMNLAECFLIICKRLKTIGIIEDYSIRRHVKFGRVIDIYNKETKVFNDQLSGVELIVTLPILKNQNCQDFCLITPTTCAPVTIFNQDDEPIASVPSGGSYQVTEFSGIQNNLNPEAEIILQNLLE